MGASAALSILKPDMAECGAVPSQGVQSKTVASGLLCGQLPFQRATSEKTGQLEDQEGHPALGRRFERHTKDLIAPQS